MFLSKLENCPNCFGSGKHIPLDAPPCHSCGGAGQDLAASNTRCQGCYGIIEDNPLSARTHRAPSDVAWNHYCFHCAAAHPLLQSRSPARPAGPDPLPEELLEEYQNANHELELTRRNLEHPDRPLPDHTANARLDAAEQMMTLGDHAAARFILRTLGNESGISQANAGRLHDLRQAIAGHCAGRLNRMLEKHPNPAADAAANATTF